MWILEWLDNFLGGKEKKLDFPENDLYVAGQIDDYSCMYRQRWGSGLCEFYECDLDDCQFKSDNEQCLYFEKRQPDIPVRKKCGMASCSCNEVKVGVCGRGCPVELITCPDCLSDLEDNGTCGYCTEELDIDELTKQLDEMTDEDFHKAIKEIEVQMENKCHPDTCEGECQGMGWCDVAVEFRTAISFR